MEIKEMSMAEVEARAAEIRSMEELTEELKAEAVELAARKAELKEHEERQNAAAEIAEGAPAEIIEETKIEEKRTMFTVDSKEYRDAFMAYIANPCPETRGTLQNVDGGQSGDAIAIPKTLDQMIWDNIHDAHPILADIATMRTGIVLEVSKHTAITAGKATKKGDSTANASASVAAENNTFVKVQLVGKDYVKYTELTYAEAKMSQGEMERYLAQEIAADIGEAMAKEVFAQILTDGAAGAQDKSSDGLFTAISKTLGNATHAVHPVIYCTAAKYYEMFGSVDSNGQPVFRDGVVVGAPVKIDSAVPASVTVSGSSETLDYIVVDPSKFVLNVVQDIMVESDRDVKEHNIVISGYARVQGCMRDNNAAAFLYE